MEIRPADPEDTSRIRAIARASFRSSYSLSPQDIDAILADAFADDTLSERVDDPQVTVLVAEEDPKHADGQAVQGFVDVTVERAATIRWLHVDPAARGRGIGTALIEACRATAGGEETRLAARMLTDAVEGGAFVTEFGLERIGNDRSEFGGEEYTVDVFSEGTAGGDSPPEVPNEPSVRVPDRVEEEGTELVLDRDDRIPGRDAPFFPLHADPAEDGPYGYLCSGCGSTDVWADGLDRLACSDCGNLHRADEWDEAFL